MDNQNRYAELEREIEYTFRDKKHLDIAFTHTSYANEKMVAKLPSYERYEFLGDAILEFISSEYLYDNYPELPEGKLTKLRASLVCEFTLSKIARQLGLGQLGYFSRGEVKTGGRNRDSILCDMFESLLGAIYLDGGMDAAKTFARKYLLNDIEHKQRFYDSKTTLQEYAQKRGEKITYEILSEGGTDHNPIFEAACSMGNKKLAKGSGHSKKSAEQDAAYNALQSLDL